MEPRVARLMLAFRRPTRFNPSQKEIRSAHTPMKLIQSALLCSLLATTAIAVRADQQYDWVGGAAGYAGVLILDSNDNSAGTLADVVNAAIITPQGTFYF